MSEMEQLSLIDVDPDWAKEWQGMPEFTQDDLMPDSQVIISFATRKDRDEFSKMIGQRLSGETKSVWFPKAEYDKPSNYRYVDES
jgi:hypothetical protein